MTIQTLIVDDDRLAREVIKRFLRADPEYKLVGECVNGAEAVVAIRKLRPELLFLDVQMPEVDGFDVIREIAAERAPAIIFITAHDSYALRAFDVHALDYLLKPVNRQRFKKALERASAPDPSVQR